METSSSPSFQKKQLYSSGFTLIELLVVIAIIAILAVVVVLTLNPAQLLAQSRDANRVSDMATLQSALNLYTTDQSGNLQLGSTASTSISVPDPNASTTCGSLGLPSLGASSTWDCSSPSNYRLATSTGWIGVNFTTISAGAPFGSVPVDPVNQTSSGLFYAYNTNGSQFQVTANLESAKYKSQYGANPVTPLFPEIISGGSPGISSLYNPSGLVAYWPLDEGNGSSTTDASGNGSVGTWYGSPTNGTYYGPGEVGSYAGEFNAANDYIRTPASNFIFTTAGTFSIWVDQLSTPSTYANLIGLTSGVFYIEINPTSDRPYLNLGASCSSTLSNNTWQLVTGTWTFSATSTVTSTIYLNGQPCGTGMHAATSGLTSYFQVGATVFSGALDDARIYNRALSPAEIMALYDAEK